MIKSSLVYKAEISNGEIIFHLVTKGVDKHFDIKFVRSWLDNHDVCRVLKISPRTLQTLRDNGMLAFTKIGNRTYYRPKDVERIVSNVEDRRKEAYWNGRTI